MGGSEGATVAGRRTPLAACLAITVALTGCAGKVIVAGDVSVLVSERPKSGMDALGGGQLEIVGGCLGAGGTVIVWPYGTKVVEEEPLTIDIPDNGTFTLGDDVHVGGGYVVEHSSGERVADPLEVAGVTVPDNCAEHDVFLAR